MSKVTHKNETPPMIFALGLKQATAKISVIRKLVLSSPLRIQSKSSSLHTKKLLLRG